MVMPEPKIEIVQAKTFLKEPKAVKGYYVDKASVSEGVTKMGYRYQYYQMIKSSNIRI